MMLYSEPMSMNSLTKLKKTKYTPPKNPKRQKTNPPKIQQKNKAKKKN